MQDFPVNFQDKVRMPGAANGTGYPYRISAMDLMANFNFAALDADETWVESVQSSLGGGRKLKLPALPDTGKHVLGCVDGTLQWIETEEC